jgi:hypothetical protein
MEVVLLLLLLVAPVHPLECDWSPHPNSPLNNLPIDTTSGDTGSFLSTTRLIVPPRPPSTSSPTSTTSEMAQLDLYSVGTGDDATLIVHLFADTAYGRGYVHGSALKANVTSLILQTDKHFELLAGSGSLDVTNDTAALLKRLGYRGALAYVANVTAPHTPSSIFEELHGLADGACIVVSCFGGLWCPTPFATSGIP